MKRLSVLLSRIVVALMLASSAYQSAFAVGIVSPPVAGAWVSSAFGSRVHPTTGAPDFHAGVDYAAPMNSPVKAIAQGKVVRAGWKGLLGNTVEVAHANGDVSMYGHLNKISVRIGQGVTNQTVVGLVGSTGRSTGPHLHLTIKRGGAYLDPIAYLASPANAKSVAIASRNTSKGSARIASNPDAASTSAKSAPKPSAAEIADAKSTYEKLAKEAETFKLLFQEGAISRNDASEKQLAANNALRYWEALRS